MLQRLAWSERGDLCTSGRARAGRERAEDVRRAGAVGGGSHGPRRRRALALGFFEHAGTRVRPPRGAEASLPHTPNYG